MANAQILRNATVEIQTALGVAKTITNISQNIEAVITATHDFAIGDLIVIKGVAGMTQINDRVVRVKSISTTVSFVAEGLDSTIFLPYASGGTLEKVMSTIAFDNITQLSLPDEAPEEIDVTSISDSEKQNVFGMDPSPKGTLSLLADPVSATSKEVQKARAENLRRVFKVTLQSGYVAIFNAFVAGGAGFDGSTGAAGTASIALTLRNAPQWFAS